MTLKDLNEKTLTKEQNQEQMDKAIGKIQQAKNGRTTLNTISGCENNSETICRKIAFVSEMWLDKNKFGKPTGAQKQEFGTLPETLEFSFSGSKKSPSELTLSSSDLMIITKIAQKADFHIVGYSFGTNISVNTSTVFIHLKFASSFDSAWKLLPKLG